MVRRTVDVATRPPLRVLQLATSFEPGGVQKHVLDLAEALAAAGHRATVAGTSGEWAPVNWPGFLDLPLAGITGAGGRLTQRLGDLVRSVVLLRRYLKQHSVDVVHAHEVAPLLVGWLATRSTRPPVVFSFHGCEAGREAHYSRAARMFATQVLVPGERLADALAGRNGPDRGDLEVIGYGIAPRAKAIDDGGPQAQHDLEQHGGQRLVTVARLHRQKGIDVLIHALRHVVECRPDVSLVVVGAGPAGPGLESLADQLGLGDRVVFVGHRDDPSPWLHAADLFVLPSRWEALPLSIVEAFQAGLPVVATDVGSVAELVDEAVGVLVEREQPAALASAVLRLLADDELRSAMARGAASRAEELRFRPDHVHGRIIGVYERLAGRGVGSQRGAISS